MEELKLLLVYILLSVSLWGDSSSLPVLEMQEGMQGNLKIIAFLDTCPHCKILTTPLLVLVVNFGFPIMFFLVDSGHQDKPRE